MDKRLRNIIGEYTDPDKVTESTNINDLGLDSLDGIEFIFRIEQIFGIRIEDSESAEFLSKTIGEIQEEINRKIAAKAATK